MARSTRPSLEDALEIPVAVYHIYGVVDGLPRRWRPPDAGVGQGVVEARPFAGLSLLVTPLPGRPARTAGALARHDDIVSSLLVAPALLPFRFGTVVAAGDLDAWLVANLARFRAALPILRGCVEMTVRLVGLDDGWATALDAVAERLVERAALPCRRADPASGTRHATTTLAFLVPDHERDVFLARIAPVASHARGLAVVPSGPWPAYSFAPTPVAADTPLTALAG